MVNLILIFVSLSSFFQPAFRYDICTYKNKPCGTLGELSLLLILFFFVCVFFLSVKMSV